MTTPYEVLFGPLTVYVAPVGTAFPAVNAAPAGSWFKLGTNGAKNYDEPGVVVTHNQTINGWKPAGGTADRKASRTAESMLVEFTLVDLTPEQYAKIMNDATVTVQAGPPAVKRFPLLQGSVVTTFAMVARGLSAVNDALPAQYQIGACYQAASPKPSYQKDKPAGLDIQFACLDDGSAVPWELIEQTA